MHPLRNFQPVQFFNFTVALSLALATQVVGAAEPAELLAQYEAQAGKPANPARGQQFFTSRHGQEWRCSSCHGTVPVSAGQHAATGKTIGPLAPAFNARRFSDPAKVEKWFGRNCNDVVGRACTASEKADVIGWLITLKP